jgi:hypothetical protein
VARGLFTDWPHVFVRRIRCLLLGTVCAGGSSGSTSIFRSFRLLRVLKLAKSINSLRVLLSTVVECISNVAYMTLLLFLFVFMFAVMGVQGEGGGDL